MKAMLPFEGDLFRKSSRFEGMAAMTAIRAAKEAGQEVRMTFSMGQPRSAVIIRHGAPAEVGKEHHIAIENVEKWYELSQIKLDPSEQQLLDHLEGFAEEIHARADNLYTSVRESNRETYGEDEDGYPNSYRDLGTAGKLLHYLRNRQQSDLLWRIRDVESIATGLIDTVRTIAYQGLLEDRPLDQEAFDCAIRHIDNVRESLVAQLDQIQKEIA